MKADFHQSKVMLEATDLVLAVVVAAAALAQLGRMVLAVKQAWAALARLTILLHTQVAVVLAKLTDLQRLQRLPQAEAVALAGTQEKMVLRVLQTRAVVVVEVRLVMAQQGRVVQVEAGL